MPRTLVIYFFTLAAFVVAGASEAQTSSGNGGNGGFSIELSVADVGIDLFDSNRLAIGVRPLWCLRRNGRWCIWIDICRILRPWPDPWPDPIINGLNLEDLEVGPGWMIAPVAEIQLRQEGRFRPSLYFGAGIQQVDGRTTDLGDRGRFTTDASTSPMVMYGFRFAQGLSDRVTLRFQVGASTAFQDDLELTAAAGGASQRFKADGRSLTNGIVGVSLGYRFGG